MTLPRPLTIPLAPLALSAALLLASFAGSASAAAPTGREAKLLATDGSAGDLFGGAVALSGDTAIIGSYQDDDTLSNSGSAYVYTRSGGAWTQDAKLAPADAATDDNFGWSVAVSGDTAIIGSPRSNNPLPDSGSAYVYTRTGSTWTLQAKLVAADGGVSHWFGHSVAVSGDTAIVGSAFDDDHGTNSGSAYVYLRSGTSWALQAKLVPADGAEFDNFGRSVAMSGDTAIMSAPGDDDRGPESGSAYIYTRSGATWTQALKLVPGDGEQHDRFGASVAASGDTVIVGSDKDDSAIRGDSGSAYVYTLEDATWTQQAKLVAADAGSSDAFGASVSVSGDTALIASPFDDDKGSDSGSAYVFTRVGASWTQVAKLVAADGASPDRFGASTSLSGGTALIGSPLDNDNGPVSGSAYIYAPDGDADDVSDNVDNCPTTSNADQGDLDGDGLGDACDADDDDDGLSDEEETVRGTDPRDADSDDDGFGDGDEVGLGTDPLDVDSDGDGFSDGDEVAAGTDPMDPTSFPLGSTPTLPTTTEEVLDQASDIGAFVMGLP